MAFTTQVFLFLFFPLCIIVYFIAKSISRFGGIGKFIKRLRILDWLLILFSLGFYMWANVDDGVRLVIYVILVYLLASWIYYIRSQKRYLMIYCDKSGGGEHKLYLSTCAFFAQ